MTRRAMVIGLLGALLIPAQATAGTVPGTIVYADLFGGTGIYTRTADGGGLTHVVDEFGAWGPRWSPDGSGFAFDVYRRGGSRRIDWVDADGSNRRTLVGPHELPAGWTVFGIAWSPDGKRLAACLVNDERNTTKLFSIARNGSEVVAIAPDTCYPDWSWSQDRIAAISQKRLVTMYPDGSNVTDVVKAMRMPRWSPDGSRIVYERVGVDGNPDLTIVGADGSSRVRLTETARSDWSPEWSPAGDAIVWAREDRTNPYRFSDLWTMADDGSNPVALAVTPDVDEDFPDWHLPPT